MTADKQKNTMTFKNYILRQLKPKVKRSYDLKRYFYLFLLVLRGCVRVQDLNNDQVSYVPSPQPAVAVTQTAQN